MMEPTENAAAFESRSEQILRSFSLRSRLCHYLFVAGSIWIGIGVVSFVLRFPTLFVFSEVVGFAVLTVAVAVMLAIHRCPACDNLVNLFGSIDRCSNCDESLRL